MLWRTWAYWWSALVMQLMPSRGSWISSVLPLSCSRYIQNQNNFPSFNFCWIHWLHLLYRINKTQLDGLNEFDFRWCYETHHRWALGPSGLCHMDSRFLFSLYISLNACTNLFGDKIFSSIIYFCTETCLSDIKKMEPIDGLSRINKVSPLFLGLPLST